MTIRFDSVTGGGGGGGGGGSLTVEEKDSEVATDVTTLNFDGSDLTDVGGGKVDIDTVIAALSSTFKQRLPHAVIPTTTLQDGEFIAVRVAIPSGETLRVWTAGLQTPSNGTPAGTTLALVDETGGAGTNVIASSLINRSNPIVSVNGLAMVSFRIRNESGSQQDLSAFWVSTMD